MPGGRPSAYWPWTLVGRRAKTQRTTATSAVRRWICTWTPPAPGTLHTARAALAVALSYPTDYVGRPDSEARRAGDDGRCDERKAKWDAGAHGGKWVIGGPSCAHARLGRLALSR